MVSIILLAPLFGAIVCGFGHKWLGEKAATWLATGVLFFVCLLSWIVFLTFDGEIEPGQPFAHMVENAALVAALKASCSSSTSSMPRSSTISRGGTCSA